MTQVITVSAPTAAYAASAQRPPPGRPLTASPLENTIREWRTKAIENGDPGQKAVLSLVKPPALALLFLTMPSKLPQVTVDEANQQYKLNGTRNTP